MVIEQIELYRMKIPLKEPFVISLGRIENAENIIVIIRTVNGISGFGECSPYMTINGESADTCFIVGEYFGKVLIKQDATNIKDCMALLNRMIFGNSSIKSAFDMALHDIAARHAEMPLYRFLGGDNKKVLFTDMTVSIGNASKMAEDAYRFVQSGFPAIKVKLGESVEADVERIKKIREAIGNDIPLRIDANQGWKVKEAIEILQALEKYNIQFCEEPIARWNFMKLAKVKKNSPIPIMADESCCDHHDASRLAKMDACDHFNVKLGKSSGIINALKITGIAEKHNKKVQVGAFMESRLGITAAAHLALCSDAIAYCDFDTPLMFTQDPVSGGILYQPKGIVKVPDTPGLGVSIQEDWLAGFEKKIINS